MSSLIPCGGCGRHVRALEAACPFCGAAREAREVAVADAPQRFTGRAQILGFRATVGAVAVATALGTTACSGTAVPLYGAPAPDAGPEDSGGPGPLYGGPPDAGPPDAGQGSDAGSVDEDAGTDAGGVAPAYGAPGPEDAGPQVDSGGGAIPLYGGPPAD